MRILTWNVNALVGTVRNFVLKHGSFKEFLEAYRLDIMCIQEHKLPDSKLTKDLACVDGFESFWTFSEKKLGYSGCATWASLQYSVRGAEINCLGSDLDDHYGEGRVVCTDHGHFVLVNVYVPNAGGRPDRPRLAAKLAFLEALIAKADALVADGREVIIVGDLNVAASQQDCHPQIIHSRCYAQEELSLLSTLTSRYTDVWRQLHPDVDNVFTVWDEYTSARIRNEGLRIDFVLVSGGLLDKVVSCEVLDSTPPKWSDHAGIIIELKDMEATPAVPPCVLSSRRMKRFNDRSQPSIASIFGKRPAAAPGGDSDATGPPTKKSATAAAPTVGASAVFDTQQGNSGAADCSVAAPSCVAPDQRAAAAAASAPAQSASMYMLDSSATGDEAASPAAEQLSATGGKRPAAAAAAAAEHAASHPSESSARVTAPPPQQKGRQSAMRGGAALADRKSTAARSQQTDRAKQISGPSIQSFFKRVAKPGS